MPLTKVNTAMVSSGGGDIATNTALGGSSLNANTTGANNTAVGSGALQANTTASFNTAVGYQASYSQAGSADGNTCVGYQAGYTGNSFVDFNANNTHIGRRAGYAATTSIKNTFIGANAGDAVTTGNNNTILGRYTGNNGGLDIRTASNYIVLSDGDGNPRITVNNDGSVFIGCVTTPTSSVSGIRLSNPITVGQSVFGTGSGTGVATVMAFINGNGQVGRIDTSGSNAVYVTTSDYRLKENIAPMTGALAKVAQLKPCTYTWKADGSAGEGFIAHELQEIFPQAAVGEKDAVDEEGNIKPQGIDTSFLVATLTAAIQELKAELDATKAEVAALKAAP